MTNIEMIESYKNFCKEKGITEPGIIPSVYNDEQTFGDILSSVFGLAFRLGKQQGFDEGYAYQPETNENY